jgi:hypothetical protein
MFDPVSIVGGLLRSVVDGVFQWKEGKQKIEMTKMEFEQKKREIETAFKIKMAEEMHKPESEFRQFMLDYEGKASEQTPFMRNLRSSVRPVVTYVFLIVFVAMMFGVGGTSSVGANLQQMPPQLWSIFLAVFGFWFGGRAVMQIAETWKEGERKVNDTEGQAKVSEKKFDVAKTAAEVRGAIERASDVLEDDDESDFSPREHRQAFGRRARARLMGRL